MNRVHQFGTLTSVTMGDVRSDFPADTIPPNSFANVGLVMKKLLCLAAYLFAMGVTDVVAQAERPWSASLTSVRESSKRTGFNFVESRVPNYVLPDPLIDKSGSAVTTADQWNEWRRQEILELFRDQVYGHRPATEYQLECQQTAEVKDALGGKATGSSMIAKVVIGERSYSWPFVLFLPNKAKKPVPAIILINNRYFIPLEKAATEHDPFWCVEQIIDRGFATASFHTSHVDPDQRNGYADGIRSFFADGAPPKDDAWRSLSAWGWAASRVLDHLETVEAIDASHVAVVGHSRGGKTSLWAAAEDTRFAIGYSNNSGCGGAALSDGHTARRSPASPAGFLIGSARITRLMVGRKTNCRWISTN